MRSLIGFVVAVVLLSIAYNLFTFSVDQTQTAVVLEFGKVAKEVTRPGLHFKVPFTQSVRYLDRRLQTYDIQPREIITADQRRLVVDNYALWRVVEPRKFVEAVGGNFARAQSRLDDIVFSNLRNVLADHTLEEIVSEKRLEYLVEVTENSDRQLRPFGMEVVDVRIKRADLPQANEQAVYNRMRTEREQIAAKLRAEGEQQATQIRAEADKQVTIILAEAEKTAQQLKGEGDAEALKIYAEAYSQDPAFYRFWRTLESYKQAFGSQDTLVLSTSSSYLKLFDLATLEALQRP